MVGYFGFNRTNLFDLTDFSFEFSRPLHLLSFIVVNIAIDRIHFH